MLHRFFPKYHCYLFKELNVESNIDVLEQRNIPVSMTRFLNTCMYDQLIKTGVQGV